MKSYTEIRTPSFFSKSIVNKKKGNKSPTEFYWLVSILFSLLVMLFII